MSSSVIRLRFNTEELSKEPLLSEVINQPELFARILSAGKSDFTPCEGNLRCPQGFSQIQFSGGSYFYDPVRSICGALANDPNLSVYMEFVTHHKMGYAEFKDAKLLFTWSMRRTRRSELSENLASDFLLLKELQEEKQSEEGMGVMQVTGSDPRYPYHQKKYESLGERHFKELMSDGFISLEKDYSIYCRRSDWNIDQMFESPRFVGDLTLFFDEVL